MSPPANSNMLSFTTGVAPLPRSRGTLSRPCARMSLSEPPPIIVGGGPAGSLAAAALAHRNIPCMLLERAPAFLPFDVSRAYSMRVDKRGRQALEIVPGLLDTLAPHATPCQSDVVTAIFPDGSMKNFPRAVQAGYDGTDYRFVRGGLQYAMREFVEKLPVTSLYGAQVEDIQFLDDGVMVVSYIYEGTVHKARTRLLLACDGRRTEVAAALSRAENVKLSTKNGLGVHAYSTPAVGLCVRSLAFNPEVLKTIAPDLPEGTDQIRAIIGSDVPEKFTIGLFSTPERYVSECGGLLGTVVRAEGHPVWELKDVEEAYNLFQRVFPQIDVRAAVAKDAMQAFISKKPAKFPEVQRRKSLVVHMGETNTGGVVFLGDAAHNFPPDIGQGVNAAFQDVQVLTKVLDDMPNASITEILDSYEARRECEVDALITLARFASPYQYGQARIRGNIFMWKRHVRKRLSEWFKGLLHPAYVDMIRSPLSYSEIVRRSDVTVQRLVFAFISLVGVPLIAIVVKVFVL